MHSSERDLDLNDRIDLKVDWLTGNMEVADIEKMFETVAVQAIIDDSRRIAEVLRDREAA